MNARNPLLAAFAVGTMLFTGATFAQQATTPGTPPPIVTVRSVRPPAPSVAPAPSFQSLSGGHKWITVAQAAAYPPLANDFLDASHGANRISRTQYAAWVKQLH